MIKKIPISFNDADQARIKELIGLLGIADTYGDFPKAVKFGITLAISTIKTPQKVYTDLSDAEMDMFFQAVARHEKRLRLQDEANNIMKQLK